jgi:hypothetical protein
MTVIVVAPFLGLTYAQRLTWRHAVLYFKLTLRHSGVAYTVRTRYWSIRTMEIITSASAHVGHRQVLLKITEISANFSDISANFREISANFREITSTANIKEIGNAKLNYQRCEHIKEFMTANDYYGSR